MITRYGFVASGGGYRSFYSEGVLVWLKKNEVPVVHITSTSSGNNIVVDLYHSKSFILPFNSIDTHLLVSDMQLTLPNTRIFAQATLINEMLQAMGSKRAEIAGKRYYAKPLHILRPKDLESMTISLKDSSAQKRYFELGQQEAAAMFRSS